MKLLTKEIINKLPKLYSNESKKNNSEIPIIVKFFTPWTSFTWYITEGQENKEGWCLFGLVDTGTNKELGYISLKELESINGPFGLKIERDRHYSGTLADVL